MRRTLARTRDTLDVSSLPSTEDTELDHRTKVWTDSQERHFTIRMLSYLTIKVVFLAFLLRLMTVFSVSMAAIGFLPLAALMAAFAFSRYIRGWPIGMRVAKSLSYVLSFIVFAVFSLIGDIWTAYLAFGVAVGVAANLSHVITKQYAFFMTANERVRFRTVRRWRGAWKEFPRFRGPRFLPEIGAHTMSFPLLALPYAIGFVGLILAERSGLARYAGALSITAFLVAVPLVWVFSADVRLQTPAPLFRSVRVCWKALVTWFCYNRHQTPAAGVFKFPTKWTRIPYLRDLAVLGSLGMFAIAILSAASVTPTDVTGGIGTRLADIPGSLLPARPSRTMKLLPHERIYMEQLPPDEQLAYRDRVWKRRIQEEAQARQKRWSVSYFTGDNWLLWSLVAVTFCFASPFVAFFAVFWFVSGRLLTAFYDALEAPGGHQQSTNEHPWDIRVERILSSRDPTETEHIYIGRSHYGDYPVLLHKKLLEGHAHIMGDTKSGKTSLGIAPLLSQLIAREDSSVLIIDLKGDMGLFRCAMAEAAAAEIPFKWFTNVTGRSSHVFNPLDQSHMPFLTTNQKTQELLQSLGLQFGEGYGAGFFSTMHEIVLSTYLKKYRRIASFRELYEYLKNKDAYREIGDLTDWEKARHLVSVVDKLSEVYPLNVKPSDFPDKPKIATSRIDMPHLLQKRQVVYFYLASLLEPTTVSPVAKLAMLSLITAAVRREAGQDKTVYVFVDEFQRIVSENIKMFLEQARSMGVHFILVNQTTGQLESNGADLTDTISSCTAFKQSFKATDLKSLKSLEEASGEALYHSADWTEAIDSGLREENDDAFNVGHLPTGVFDLSTVKVKETIGPRLERNTIIELSAKPMASFVRFTEGSGYTQFSGYYTPILSEYHISEETFKARSKAPWPKETAGTVTGYPDTEETSHPSRFLEGNPRGPQTPENVPADFAKHLEDRLTGPVVPQPTTRPTSPKKGKRPK